MALLKTAKDALNYVRYLPSLVNMIWDELSNLDGRMDDVEAGVVAEGSIGTDELANLAVTEGKINTGAVSSGKLGADAVSAAKLRGDLKSGSGAGFTIALVTAAFGDPATLTDAFTGIYKDTNATKYYLITAYDDAFYAEELSAVPAE